MELGLFFCWFILVDNGSEIFSSIHFDRVFLVMTLSC